MNEFELILYSYHRHNASGYQDQTQYVDQYQHSGYNSSMQSQGAYSANGGYNQSYPGAPNSQMGYQSEYDHNSTSYQDYRYVLSSSIFFF